MKYKMSNAVIEASLIILSGARFVRLMPITCKNGRIFVPNKCVWPILSASHNYSHQFLIRNLPMCIYLSVTPIIEEPSSKPITLIHTIMFRRKIAQNLRILGLYQC